MAFVTIAVAVFIITMPGTAYQAQAVGIRFIAPVEYAISRAVDSVAYFADTVRQAGTLAAQNRGYQEEINRLQAEVVQMQELELENRDLRRLLDLRGRAPLGSLLSVNVIAQDPLAIVQGVTVDRGSDDGVTVDAPVITWRGLVGRVVEVEPTASKVLLITDVNSAVSARIQNPDSRATGVVRGTGDGHLIMQYVPRSDVLRTGDLAITSGIGGVFPSGIVVGRVLQVRQRDVDVFQEALVEPAVDVRSLERLYIVLRRNTGVSASLPLGPAHDPAAAEPGR
ncbi:MAG TPA: rod shape-determining protein MreC [Chloroflexota bacterium]|nr:rod shape-determining protein MreC [Chloroflexota bacterium]